MSFLIDKIALQISFGKCHLEMTWFYFEALQSHLIRETYHPRIISMLECRLQRSTKIAASNKQDIIAPS